MLEFGAAKAGARQAHVLPVTSLHCHRAKSASTGAVLGGDGGQAGIVPGHQEEAMGVFGTASLPSSQTICSPGCECCELARGQSGDAVWPLCTPRRRAMVGPVCRDSQGPVAPACQHSQGQAPGAALGCLTCWLCRCPARAEILLCLSWDAGGCCQRSMSPVLLCRAGCMQWAGLLRACLALGTGLTSSPGPWPAALTSQWPASHMQPYLLA